MTRLVAVPLLFALWFVTASSASAQTAPGQDQSFATLAQRAKRGEMVDVRDADGHRVRGRMADVTDTGLTIMLPEKARESNGYKDVTWTLPRRFDVAQVQEIRKVDGLKNGAGWGLVAAAGPAVAVAIYVGALCENEGGSCVAAAAAPVMLAGGAAIGALIDKAIDGNTLLYASTPASRSVRLSPILGGTRRGVALSLRF